MDTKGGDSWYFLQNEKEGKIVERNIIENLDCIQCMGSGTTAVAAKELKRDYYGFELRSDWYETCKKRLQNIYPLKKI